MARGWGDEVVTAQAHKLIVGLCQEQFGIPFPVSLFAAYYVRRASAAWAPVNHNPVVGSGFYERFDPAKAAALELLYNEEHRRLVGSPDKNNNDFPSPQPNNNLTKYYHRYILWIYGNGENMITTYIRKWGNSLAIRLPQSLLAQLNLQIDGEVEISLEEGRLILSPVKKPGYTLDELLAQITLENLHDEIDFGKPVGKEVW